MTAFAVYENLRKYRYIIFQNTKAYLPEHVSGTENGAE